MQLNLRASSAKLQRIAQKVNNYLHEPILVAIDISVIFVVLLANYRMYQFNLFFTRDMLNNPKSIFDYVKQIEKVFV